MDPVRVGGHVVLVGDGEHVPAWWDEAGVVWDVAVECAEVVACEWDIDEALVGVPGMCGGHGSGEVDPLDPSRLRCVDLDGLVVLDLCWCVIDEGAWSAEEIGWVVELEAEFSACDGVGFGV